jgi:superfamily II DNA or RNA helicase
MKASIFFQGGMLVLQHVDNIERAPVRFQFVQDRWCCEAYHYNALLPWLHEQGIRDAVPRWQHLNLELHDSKELHAYQIQALEAWKQAKGCGNLMLPIYGAKTLVGVHAIHAISTSTVIIVSTVQMLSQWYALLANAFRIEIGVYYSGKKLVRPLTVTIYDAARDLIVEHGNSFAMIICDETQHFPIQNWGEALRMAPAPFRLGLTGSSPEEQEQRFEGWQLDDLIGPIIYTLRLETLTGKQREAYRTQRIFVDLTDEERSSYNAAYEVYIGYVSEQGLQHSHGAEWVQELKRLSTVDPYARRAWLARRQVLKLLESCHGKFAALEALLSEHDGQRMLVFTESQEVAYAISRQYLVPAITRVTAGTERRYILDAFRTGRYRVVVTTELLKEGVDVPEAKVAVVLGGGTKARKYIQHLECSLCKKDLSTPYSLKYVCAIHWKKGKSLQERTVPNQRNGYAKERGQQILSAEFSRQYYVIKLNLR